MNSTRNHRYAVVAIAAGAVAGLAPACAQETGKVMIDVADCIKLGAPEARLACYESRVAAVFGERAAQAAAVRPTAPAPAPAAVITARPAEPAAPVSAAPPATPSVAVSPPPAPPTASAPAAAVTEPVQSRDYRKTRREADERAAAEAAAAAAANEVTSRVTELREVVPNAWQITLENGQVWRQTVSKHYELRPGAQVRIYSTHWGSASRLSAETINGYIQVERVR